MFKSKDLETGENINIEGKQRQRNRYFYTGCVATVNRIASFNLGV